MSVKIGDKIDDVIVLSYEGKTKNFMKLYKVKCSVCGNEKIIQYARLNTRTSTKHNVKTCKYVENADKNIGFTVNDYTIIKRTNRCYRTSAYYIAKCNICGCEFETTIGNFKRFGTQHKDCTRHLPKNPYLKRFRKIYSCMRYRTLSPNASDWKYYGGKGVSSEYYKDFITFYKDMFQSYVEHIKQFGCKDTSLDRINPNENYEKGNIRWATAKEQALNQVRYMS